MAKGELILYTTEDGRTEIQFRALEGTVWLNQREISDLFDKDIRTINEHVKNIYKEGECLPEATIRKFRIVQTEGEREVTRDVDFYNLEVILSVGYGSRIVSEWGLVMSRSGCLGESGYGA